MFDLYGPRTTAERTTVTARPTRTDAVVIGIDYGTLSGRAVVVRVSDGQELGSAVHDSKLQGRPSFIGLIMSGMNRGSAQPPAVTPR